MARTPVSRIPEQQRKSAQLGIRWPDDRKAAWDKLADRQKRTSADLARLVLEEFMTSFMPKAEAEVLGLASDWRAAGLLELAMDQRRDRQGFRPAQ